MAKAIALRHAALRTEARNVARIGCSSVDVLRQARGADRTQVLDIVQLHLRASLMEAEEALREWRDRAPRRQECIKRYRRRRQGGSPLIGQHLAAAVKLETALGEHRQRVRQLGDGLAWTLLREDPRIIFPLFAERTHHLTPSTGLAGATQVITDVHKGGELLAIDNDLTRCLGSGDLTVVPADGRWSLPLSVELKTLDVPEGLEVGTPVTVNMSAPVSSDPMHEALHAAFSRTVNANVGRIGSTQPREGDARQEAEMTKQAELLMSSLVRRPESIESERSLWKSMRNVLDRASQMGSAYDVPEGGIAFVAVRNNVGDDAMRETHRLMARLQRDGFPKGDSLLAIGHLASDDRMSAIVPPISVWPLPRDHRVALLSVDLFLACVFSNALWERAFEAAGLRLEVKRNHWVIRSKRRAGRFDPFERTKLELGVAFGAVSPRAVAEAIAQRLASPGSGRARRAAPARKIAKARGR
jgi:hypothetical protein